MNKDLNIDLVLYNENEKQYYINGGVNMVKVRDGIIGHAIGDALGVPVEFKDRESLYYDPVENMRRSYAGAAGTWSDDTSMEIATIDSYINNNSWNYDDIMSNLIIIVGIMMIL